MTTYLFGASNLPTSGQQKLQMPARKEVISCMHPVHLREEKLFPHTGNPSGSGATVFCTVKREHPGGHCVFACLL